MKRNWPIAARKLLAKNKVAEALKLLMGNIYVFLISSLNSADFADYYNTTVLIIIISIDNSGFRNLRFISDPSLLKQSHLNSLRLQEFLLQVTTPQGNWFAFD